MCPTSTLAHAIGAFSCLCWRLSKYFLVLIAMRRYQRKVYIVCNMIMFVEARRMRGHNTDGGNKECNAAIADDNVAGRD